MTDSAFCMITYNKPNLIVLFVTIAIELVERVFVFQTDSGAIVNAV